MFECDLIQTYKIKFDTSIWEPEHLVWLNNFIIPSKYRKSGIGKQILKQFTQWLDKNSYDSKLLISGCYGTPIEVLEKFYNEFGYTKKEIKGNNVYLIRSYNG